MQSPKFKKWLKLLLLVIAVTSFSLFAKAQSDTISIGECFRLARENYPEIKKQNLIAKTSQYTIENAGKGYLPQLSFSSQATYQSQTISFGDVFGNIPGIGAVSKSLPQISKDQYKIQGEIDQNIYDGGISKYQREESKASEAVRQQNLEVKLYGLKDRVKQLYFSVLLMDEQYKQNALRKADLQSEVNKAEAAFQNGTSFRSNVDELKAEVINSDMSGVEFMANRKTYLQILSVFIGKVLGDSTKLAIPADRVPIAEIKRPELKLFDLQKTIYDVQEKQLHSDYSPKLSAFFQEAYGRPTLNIIENQFGFWYITGVRFNWSLGSLYTLKNNKRILNLNREAADIDKETFIRNTNLDLTQQSGDIKKYLLLLQQDDNVIKLRASVKKSAAAQLANGVITVHDYIAQVNAENLARQTQILHHLELLQTEYQYSYTAGN
jgi:outer membrane protein